MILMIPGVRQKKINPKGGEERLNKRILQYITLPFFKLWKIYLELCDKILINYVFIIAFQIIYASSTRYFIILKNLIKLSQSFKFA